MRLTDYLPHGPAMSTPPSERVRDVLTARHSNENALFSRTGFALLICIFVSLTSAVPAFGHKTLEVRKGEDIHFGVNPFGQGTEDWQNYKDWSEFIESHPTPEYSHANTHWHMHIEVNHIGGWNKCVAEAYYYDEDKRETDEGDYVLVGGKCPDGTSTNPISPQNNEDPQFNGPATESVPENTLTTEKLVMVKATDSDSEDNPVTYSLGGADASHFSLEPSPGKPLERDLKFTIVPDYENSQDAASPYNVYVVEVTATSGTRDRKRDTKKTITITVTNVLEPPGTPEAPTVLTASETSLDVSWTEPENMGPPINDYDYRYKKTSDPDLAANWTEVTTTGLSEIIGSLEEGTSYDVQIQAKSPEGTSDWSTEGTGTTGATDPNNAAPRFLRPAKSITENSTSVLDKVEAEDADIQDSVTDYEIVGGADREQFEEENIVLSTVPLTAELRFKTAPDYENEQDANRDNVYEVIVRATSGTGGRIKHTYQTITVTVTNVQEPDDPVNPPVITDTTPGGTGGGSPSGTPLSPLPEDVTVSFTRARYEASEDDEAVTFMVQLSTTASQDAVVEYATSSGTARAGQDYEATIGTLTIPAGATRRAILVPIIDDNVVEEEETFTISLRNSNATIESGKATGVIADNDLPLISVKAEPAAVEEGGTIKFTLTRLGAFNLNRALEVPIRVTERGAFLGDIDVLPTEATFAANETTATLLVETVDDEVAEANGSVSLTITRGETYRLGDAFIATAEVIDNDGPDGVGTRDDLEVKSDVTVSFAAARYEASEGDRVLDFAVRLSTATLQEVTVQYATVTGTATAGMDYAARTGILTFPAATTEQTIRVRIIDDDVVEEEETFTVSLRRAFNAKIEVGEATGVIADNDLRVVVSIAANQTAVTEGGTAAFTLTRVGELTAPLTVPVQVTERGVFLTDEVPTAATFAANAATATLLVTTDDDGHVEANGSVTATITSGAYQIGDAASATVVVIDNDVRGVAVTPTALTIREGSSSSYMVGLDTEPTADVTVAVQVPEGAEISVTPTALTFTAANWNTKQLVVVTAAQDDDTVADDPLTIRHAVSGGDYGAVTAASVAVTILEDDPAIRIADAAALEGAGEMAFSVRLSVPSIQTVTVDWTTADGTAIAGQDYEAATGTLTFSALATTQTIRVPIIDDNLDEAAETFTVALRNSNVAITDGEATGVIADDDLPVVNLTTDLAGVVEGETVAFTLTRIGDLTVPLRVPVRVTERGSFLADGVPTAATFAANAATTTLLVATDDDERDEADGAVTATITSGPTHRVGDAASATVPVIDNDVTDVPDVPVTPGVTVTPTVLRVLEGNTASYTVVLDSEPTADVTVAIQVPEDTEVAVDETELTFTTEDWNQAQTVTVTAAQDDDAVADDTVVLTHEVRGGNYDTVTAASVAVTILEDDMSALSVANAVASEGDGEMAFSVRLNLASSQTVTVEYVTAGGTATAGRDYETTTGTLTFSALETEQTIRVPIIDDDIDEAVETLTVMLINASNATIKDGKATGIITDDDVRGVTVTPTALMIREGDSASYTVVLDSEPTADVTVEIQVPEDVEVAVDVTKLTFTAEDWNQSQTVTVTAAQDADAVADDPVTLTHVVSGGDYRSVTVASVAVTILEDDTPTLLIADAEASEGDGEMAFAVRLSVPSSRTVTVEYATADGTALAGTDYEETTGTLTFSAETTAQTIRVPIIDDDLDEVAEAFTVALVNASNAIIEDGEAIGEIADNDLPVVSVTADEAEVEEGETVAFTVTRIGDLTVPLTVPVDIKERGAFLADGAPTEVTFAVDAATTTLLVATDDDQRDEADGAVSATITSGTTHRAGESASVTVSVTDNGESASATVPVIDNGESASATVPVIDNDERGVTVTPTALTVDEGGSGSYTVVLTSEPTADVTVEIQVPEDTDITVDQTELTFTAEDWHQVQTVTVTAAQDADAAVADDPVTITHAVSGGDYEGVTTAEVEVTIIEDDTTGVTISITALEVAEGDTGRYTLVLDTEPIADVTVEIQVPEDTDIAVSPLTLTFTADTWNTPQTVTVTAAQDDDAVADDPVIITHAVSGGDYEGVTTAEVEVTIIEDDTTGVTISITALEISEGDTGRYTLVLDTEPTADVTVEIQAPEDTDITVAPLTLTFTADTWNTPQTVTVTAAQDDDAVAADPLTLTHAVSGGDYEGVTTAGVEVTIIEDDTTGVTISITALEVAEGDTGHYTIVLDTEPTADVTVEIQVPEDTDIAVAPLTLTFTAANWSTPQTVTVTAAQDDDAVTDDPVTITHIVSGGDYEDVTAAGVEVTITEDDTAGVTISTDALEVPEGSSQSYTLVLDTEPATDVTVEIQMPEDAEIAVSPLALTFTAANWNTPQTVAVTAAQDDDAIDDNPVTITHIVSGGDYEGVTAAGVVVTIIEDDTTGVTISITALEISEGDTGRYTLVLDTEPTADVAVEIQVPENAEIAVAPLTLTFTADTWDTPQTVTVTAAQDDDAVADDPVIITHAVSGGDYQDVTAANVEVTIIEDDTTGVTISITALEISEGDTGRYTLVLDTEPTADVTVEIQVPEDTDIAVAPLMLTFTAANWSTPQTVTVTAAQDDDAVTDDPVTITHIVSGGDYEDVTAAGVEVTITEDDTAGVTISTDALEVPEGSSQSYTLVLDTEPAADVTVEIQMPEDAEIAVSPLALTFTAANWNTPQTVAVTAAQDDDAIDDNPVTITHIVSGGDYEGVTAAGVVVTIIEDDTTGVTISITALEIAEGDTGRYTLVLDTEPTADVAVEIQVPENAEIAVAPLTLTFTADTWDTPQTVTVTAAQDDDAVADDPVIITHAVSGGDYQDVTAANVEVTIIEDDTTGVTISITALEISEGDTGRYTLVLDTEPTADVTVEIQVPEDTDIAVAPLMLTFTAANWNTPQTVAVTAAQDDDAVTDDPVTITHTVSGGDYEDVTAAGVEVTITEDDTAGVTISTDALEVSEGSSQSYTLVLDTEPAADVTVEIQMPEDAEIAVSPLALTFTAANWNTPQTVAVTAAQDDDAIDDSPVTLTHIVSGGDYEGVTAAGVVVTIIEDDTTGVTISITALEVAEGDTGRYTLVLDTEPTADVTVEIQVPEDTDIAVSPLTLTFTADTWNTPQTVTVTAAQDADAVDDDPVTLTHAVSGGDYQDVTAAEVEVTIIEDDTTGVTISITALEVAEGDTGRYTLVLDTEPAADVTVEIQVPENAEIAVSPLTLTFTADNWNTPQTVAVTAAQDDDAVTDDPVTITHAVSGGDYEDVTAAGVEVTITEDDTAGVTISTDALEVSEGSSQSYTVVLDTEPAADVMVVVAVPEGAEVAVSPLTLTFTADNWNTPQTVAVTAAQDDDAIDDDPVTLTHAVSGGDYEGVTAADVEVSIIEDDTPGVTVSETALTIPEGDSQSYMVVLDTEPAADVMVVVAVPEDAEVAVDETTLTFTAANWNTPQTVAVTAAHDDDAIDDDPVTLTHTVSGGDYEGVSASEVTVTITEDDTPALTIADANATEGDGQITFTVRLNVASSLAVKVDWATADDTATQGADYAETTGTLTFDALETEQTITVPLLDDALDENDETFTVALTNAANATLDDAEATGTIADNDDTPALTIADAEAAEGDGEITFAVTLGAASSLEVTVDWTTADGTATADADYVAADGRLTFAPGQTEATIAVAVFNDALDEGDETLTIALSDPTNATIADGTATGTIADDDPSVEKAWLARFGRTTASQVMDAVSDRLTGRSGGDAHLTVGGQRVTLASGRGSANAVDRTIPAKNASSAGVLSQHPFYHLTRSSFAEIISRSSFQVSSAKPSEEQGARWTAWGRGATTRFRSEEVDLSLTGGAATGLLGGDWQQGRMLAGLAVAHSVGTGEFDVHTAEQAFRKGELGTYLTSVHPYLRVAVTERLSAWGLFGYGRGQMERMGDRPDTDIGMQMGGLGARGALLSPTESSDFDVALKSDAFLVRMDTDAVIQPALETMTSRLRLQLEGGRPVELESGRMSPSLEVGVRHDGGDAETGLGLEVGGSLGYTHAQRGLALQATARRLLVHQANGYEEWGVGGSLSLDPGALGRGPSLRMQSSWGATSGMDRLWSQRSAADLARSTQAAGAGLFDAELGYGLDALGGLLTPYAHVASSGQGPRTYGLGGRLQVERSLRVDLVGERRERTAARAGHELKLRSTLYW